MMEMKKVGFITVWSFIAALAEGGWFWLIFIIMLCILANKVVSDKKSKSQIPPDYSAETVDPQDPRPPISRTPYGDGELRSKLTKVCSQYTSPDFYVAELIPQDKLQNALKAYPLSEGDQPIALIDATVFGSAENGMLIGEFGISWHNAWYHFPSNDNLSEMPWAELSTLAITADGSWIKIGSSASITVLQFDKLKLVTLLKRLGDTWMEPLTTEEEPPPYKPEVTQPMPPPPVASERPNLVKTDVNTADFDSLLALPGIGAADANIIFHHIKSNGPLVSIDEMSVILNLKPHIAERLRPLVTFSTTEPQPPEPPKPNSPAAPAAEQHPMPPKAQGPVRAPIDF